MHRVRAVLTGFVLPLVGIGVSHPCLTVDHPVGIWDSEGTRLVIAVVLAAREGLTTVGGYNPPSQPVLLANDPPFTSSGVRVQVVSIEFVEVRTLGGAGFGRPTTPTGTPPGPFYGASFAFGATTVPEPGTAALVAAGLVLTARGGAVKRRPVGRRATRTGC